MEAMAV
jgi:hypothetical protein